MRLLQQVRIKKLLPAFVFIFALVVAQFSSIQPAYAAIVAWDGEATDGLFSSPTNWVGDVLPVDGDSISLPSISGSPTVALTNDLVGVTFSGITVGGAAFSTAYTLDTATLSSGASVTALGTDATLNLEDLIGSGDLTIDALDRVSFGSIDATGDVDINTTKPDALANDIIAGSIIMTSDFIVSGALTVNSDLAVSQAIDVGTLNVTGNLTMTSDFTAPTINVDGTLTVDNTFTTTDVTAGTLVANTTFTAASVTADAVTMTSAFVVSGALTVNGDLAVSQAIDVGTLNVTGNLTMTADFAAPTINVTGNATIGVALTGNTTLNVSGTLTVDNNFTTTDVTAGTLVANSTFTATNVTADAVTMNSAFIVSGTLTVNGDLAVSETINVGTLVVTGNLTNTSSFTATTINVTGNFSPTVDFTAPTVNVTGNVTITGSSYSYHQYNVAGNMTIGTGSFSAAYLSDGSDVTGDVVVETSGRLVQASESTVSLGSLTVKNGGEADLYGVVDYPVTFGSGASTAAPALTYNSSFTTINGETGEVEYNTLEFTQSATLLNDLRLSINGNAYSGAVEFANVPVYNGFKIYKSNTSQGILIIDGEEVRNPVSRATYEGDKPSDSIIVGDNETAEVNGLRDTATVYRGGSIAGTGTLVNLNALFGSTVAPGNSPGVLTVLNNLNLQADSILEVEVESMSAYDQLVVGEEAVSAPVNITDAILNVSLSEGFQIAQGDKFTIIDNLSDFDVVGTFANKSEGSVFSVADGTFSISYVGGDGNDVVLTVVSAPSVPEVTAPNTGLRMLLSNPLAIFAVGTVAAGFFVYLARRRANA